MVFGAAGLSPVCNCNEARHTATQCFAPPHFLLVNGLVTASRIVSFNADLIFEISFTRFPSAYRIGNGEFTWSIVYMSD